MMLQPKTLNVKTTLARAKFHAKKGQFDEARQLYHSVLEAFPQNQPARKALNELQGSALKANHPTLTQVQIDSVIALYSNGQRQEAFDALDILIKQYPKEALLYNISGTYYASLGQLEAAVKQYEQALAIKPDSPETHSNLGNVLKDLGQPEAAVKSFKRALAINPDYAKAHNNLGNVLKDLGQLEAAVKSLERALAINPGYANAHSNLGNVLKDFGQLEAAVKSFKRALAINPDYLEVHLYLGHTLHDLGQVEMAIKSFERALAIHSDNAEAYFNLGITFCNIGQTETAVKSYEKALAINPDYAKAYFNLSTMFKQLGQLAEAKDNVDKAIQLQPDFADAYYNRGLILVNLQQKVEAMEDYDRAVQLKPDHVKARWNLSLLQLHYGYLSEGYKNYEARWEGNEDNMLSRNFSIPRWTGETLTGKNILIWGEQGIGDEIGFASIIPEFEKLNCNVGIECAAKLVEVFQWAFPWAEVREAGDINCEGSVIYSQFHYQIPMGSLAPIFRKTLDDFRIKQKPFIPRLKEGEQKVRAGLKLKPGQPLIGLCWRSSLQTVKRSIHYLSVEDLVPLKAIKGAVFLAVQYDDCLPELDRARALGLPIHYYTNIDQKNDLASTCALLGACDLVISAGTAVSELSGSLGVPTCVFSPDYDCKIIWHPTVRHMELNSNKPSLLIEKILSEMPQIIDWANEVTTSGRCINF